MATDKEIGKLVIRLVAEVKDLKKGLSEAQGEIKKFTDQSKKSGESFSESIAGIKTQYLKFAAITYGAYRALLSTLDFAKIGAQAQQVEQSFYNLTRSIGVNGRALINEMKKISAVWVDETGIMIKAQRLLAEGLSPDEIVKLTRAAVVAAKMMGTDITTAFEMVSEAVITLRTRSLKAAFPMEATEVIEKYARSLGTVGKYLNETGQRQAILNEIIDQANKKAEMLGNTLDPGNYDKIQKFNSAINQLKETISKLVTNAVVPFIDSLLTLGQQLESSTPAIIKHAREWFLLATPSGGLGQAYMIYKKISELIGKTKPPEPPSETRLTPIFTSQMKALEKIKQEEDKQRAKKGIDDRKLMEDLTKFRLANAEQRIQAEANIHKIGLQIQRTQEITALKLAGKDTFMAELEWEKKLAQADYEMTIKNLRVKRESEIQNAKQSGMDVRSVKEKYHALEKEAEMKLVSELAEIDAKRALSFEALMGMTEAEMRKSIEYSRALREGDLDEWMRMNRVKQAEEAKLHNQIISNQIAENQFRMSKEDRLKKEIELTNELLMRTQERLAILSEEDEGYIDILNQVENYKNKISELNYELERQTATFEQLAVRGLKQYSVSLQQDLIDKMENLVPRAVDLAGNSFKTLFRDLTNGTKSASEAFKDFATNFGQAVMDMIIELGLLIAKMELMKALNLSGNTGGETAKSAGVGNWVGMLLNLIGGLFQEGGQIRGPAGIDRVPIRATAGEYVQPVPAVKYYGIDVMEKIRRREIPREVLLLLSSGIRSKPYSQPSFMMQMGGIVPSLSPEKGNEKKTEITLVNVVDPREMDSWAASARGQNAIINVISSRAETVRRILQ